MKYSELKKILRKNKCKLIRQGANHEIWYSSLTDKQFTVARHNTQDVRNGTLKSILDSAGITL